MTLEGVRPRSRAFFSMLMAVPLLACANAGRNHRFCLFPASCQSRAAWSSGTGGSALPGLEECRRFAHNHAHKSGHSPEHKLGHKLRHKPCRRRVILVGLRCNNGGQQQRHEQRHGQRACITARAAAQTLASSGHAYVLDASGQGK